MLGGVRIERPSGDEAEKPFWISYADLMTSLAILFLVVMVAFIAALTIASSNLAETQKKADKYEAQQAARDQRDERIQAFWKRVEARTKNMQGVNIDRDSQSIDFGSRAQFDTGSTELKPAGVRLIRRFTPVLMDEASSAKGRLIVREIVVDGFTDKRGSYLYNLNLSLGRSQRVLCSLLASSGPAVLNGQEKQRVSRLFKAGGFSDNNQKESLKESRRVEMRVEFKETGERPAPAPTGSITSDFGSCALDS